jgi:hypothetical protein
MRETTQNEDIFRQNSVGKTNLKNFEVMMNDMLFEEKNVSNISPAMTKMHSTTS